jgi:hypothetical protein
MKTSVPIPIVDGQMVPDFWYPDTFIQGRHTCTAAFGFAWRNGRAISDNFLELGFSMINSALSDG